MHPSSKRIRMMRRLPPHQQRPVLRGASWLAVLVGIVLLGHVGYSLADAQIYQAYASWQLDRSPRAQMAVTTTTATTLAAGAPRVVEEPAIIAGSAVGRISIPRLGLSVNILEGTDTKALGRGVGHITGTALPGEHGNIGIAGHRDTFFRALRNVRQNDDILLTTPSGTYRYEVDSIRVVAPEDTSVLHYTGDSILTLVTCHPFNFIGSAPDRFIVRAHRH
jgi:sortase A